MEENYLTLLDAPVKQISWPVLSKNLDYYSRRVYLLQQLKHFWVQLGAMDALKQHLSS